MITGKHFTVSVPNCLPPLRTKYSSTVFTHILRRYTYGNLFRKKKKKKKKTSLDLVKCIYC